MATADLPGAFPDPIDIKSEAPFTFQVFQALRLSSDSKQATDIGRLEKALNKHKLLLYISSILPINPIQITLFSLLLSGAAIRILYKKNLILLSQLLAGLWPSFKSIAAIERPEKDDDERWLTYWICYSLFGYVDHAVSAATSDKLKYYVFGKLITLNWIAGSGGLVIYRRIFRKILEVAGHFD